MGLHSCFFPKQCLFPFTDCKRHVAWDVPEVAYLLFDAWKQRTQNCSTKCSQGHLKMELLLTSEVFRPNSSERFIRPGRTSYIAVWSHQCLAVNSPLEKTTYYISALYKSTSKAVQSKITLCCVQDASVSVYPQGWAGLRGWEFWFEATLERRDIFVADRDGDMCSPPWCSAKLKSGNFSRSFWKADRDAWRWNTNAYESPGQNLQNYYKPSISGKRSSRFAFVVAGSTSSCFSLKTRRMSERNQFAMAIANVCLEFGLRLCTPDS